MKDDPPTVAERQGVVVGIGGRSPRLFLLFLLFFAVGVFLLALVVGGVHGGVGAVVDVVFGRGESLVLRVVLELRLPRAGASMAVGGLLAVAGVLMQTLLRNPLADPYILGLSGGAACGAILALLLGLSGVWVDGGAWAGALLTMLLVFWLAGGPGGWDGTRLLLTGVVVASGWGAGVSFLLYLIPEDRLRGALFWIMGDLSRTGSPWVPVMILVTIVLICWPLARSLNQLAQGPLRAASLGVAVAPLRLVIYLLASLATAAAVSAAGSIGFVGLVTPHLLRLLGCEDHRVLVPGSVLLGGGLLTLADSMARTVIAPQQMPVGILTALLGAPLFLFLLHRSGR